jgi:hypothetical protein
LNRSSFTGRPSKQFISHWPAMSISRLETVKIARSVRRKPVVAGAINEYHHAA